MSKARLHPAHKAVAHSSKHRTRLRVPKCNRKHAKLHEAQHAIQRIPGVRSVEINHDTGSLLIHHDETPGLLDEISAALAESAPELLAALLIPGGEEAEIGLGMLSNMFKKVVVEPFVRQPAQGNAGNGGGVLESRNGDSSLQGRDVKQYLPLAFVAVGLWQMIQEEALLSGIAPVALFYYGFDLYWKLQQRELAPHVEAATEAAPTTIEVEKRAPRGS